jgi:hypothetical protein
MDSHHYGGFGAALPYSSGCQGYVSGLGLKGHFLRKSKRKIPRNEHFREKFANPIIYGEK